MHRGRRLWLVRVPVHIYRHFTDSGAGHGRSGPHSFNKDRSKLDP